VTQDPPSFTRQRTVRLPRDLDERIAARAKRDRRTFNDTLILLLVKKVVRPGDHD
jgi:hypothetical protein